MTARPSYIWSMACAWALTLAVGALTVSGVLAKFLPAQDAATAPLRVVCVVSFACVAALSLANANNAAYAAQHAASRSGQGKVFWPAMICAIGFASASVIGVDLGWGVMAHGASPAEMPQTSAVLAAGAFLGFAKIAMSWIIEGRKAMDKADAEEAERLDNARFDARRQADLTNRPAANVTHFRPGAKRMATGAAALALGAAIGAPHSAAETAPAVQVDAPYPTASEAPVRRAATHPRKPTRIQAAFDARVAQARQMLAEQNRPSNREIARRTHLSASKVDRLAREMIPLRDAQAA